MTMPYRLQNGAGNYPDANKFMSDYDYLEAIAQGNFLLGAGFETWTGGTSFTNPANGTALADNWTLEKGGTSGATANIVRESSTIDTGTYSLKVDITGAGSANSYLRLKQSATNPARFKGLHLVFGMKLKVPTASKVRLSITDGVTTQYSSYHTGDGTWQKLTAEITVSSSVTEITVKTEIVSDSVMAIYADSGFVYLISSQATAAAVAALDFPGPGDPSIEGRLGAAETSLTTLSGRALGKNRLRNGTFSVNQRGATSVADAASHLDGWYALHESGNVTVAQMTDQETGAPTSLKLTQPDVSAKRIGTAQYVASLNCRDLRGQSVVFSARIKCSASQAIRFAILEHTGTADAPTLDVVGTWGSTNYTASNFFIAGLTVTSVGSLTPSAATWTSISLNGTIGGSANNVYVFIWTEGTLAQNGTLEINRAKLEQGTSATSFDLQNPKDEQQFADDFPQYYARAWVNFNGTGTVAIRASGNVTSITDNGTGDYTVNLTTSMPDANFTTVCTGQQNNTAGTDGIVTLKGNTTQSSVSSIRVACSGAGISTATLADFATVNVAIFR